MHLYTDVATHCVLNHVYNGLRRRKWAAPPGYKFVVVTSVSSGSHKVIPKHVSQHSCGAHTDVRGTLASLVTAGLQLQDSNPITGP